MRKNGCVNKGSSGRVQKCVPAIHHVIGVCGGARATCNVPKHRRCGGPELKGLSKRNCSVVVKTLLDLRQVALQYTIVAYWVSALCICGYISGNVLLYLLCRADVGAVESIFTRGSLISNCVVASRSRSRLIAFWKEQGLTKFVV
jgi:hypothetical protein